MASEVTDVKIFEPKKSSGKIVAFAKVTVNDDLIIDGVKVINGAKGLFVGMPTIKSKEGTYSEIVYSSTKELKTSIQNAVLAKYKSLKGQTDTVEDDDDLPF